MQARTTLTMLFFEQKASCSPKLARVGIATLLTAALAITGIAYTRRHDADFKPSLTGTFDGGPYAAQGKSRRSMPNTLDQTSLDLRSISVPISDPLTVEAGRAILSAVNIERNRTCASKGLHDGEVAIQYARKAMGVNGTATYTLEVDFGNDVVFARVAMLPSKVGTQFRVIFTIPGPCEDGVQNLLAVSALGM